MFEEEHRWSLTKLRHCWLFAFNVRCKRVRRAAYSHHVLTHKYTHTAVGVVLIGLLIKSYISFFVCNELVVCVQLQRSAYLVPYPATPWASGREKRITVSFPSIYTVGGGRISTPGVFFADSKKTAALRVANFVMIIPLNSYR